MAAFPLLNLLFRPVTHTVRASREVRWEVGAGECGDIAGHAHFAYS